MLKKIKIYDIIQKQFITDYTKGVLCMKRKRNFQPEAKYYVDQKITLNDIQNAYVQGSTITGKVIKFNSATEIVEVDLGNGIKGVLPWNEATIYDLSFSLVEGETSIIPKQIAALLNKSIRVKVSEITDNKIMLSRKRNMMEALKVILSNTEKKYDAIVIGKYRYGVFYDIGEGIIAFCHITEFSNTYVSDVRSWISLGEQHVVEFIQMNENYKIQCSRKRAFPLKMGYELYKPGQIIYVKVSGEVYQNNKLTGYFVELNPVVTGIADITDSSKTIKYGDLVLAIIKSVDNKKKKVKLRIIA